VARGKPGVSQGRGFAAWPRLRRVAVAAALPRGRGFTAALPRGRGFTAASPRGRGFAATHGPWHVPTTINIEIPRLSL